MKKGEILGEKKNHPSIMSITRCLESLRDQITLPKKNKNGSNNWEMKYFFTIYFHW
jgi:hypothetical protein